MPTADGEPGGLPAPKPEPVRRHVGDDSLRLRCVRAATELSTPRGTDGVRRPGDGRPHGAYADTPGQSWTGGYLKSDPAVQAVGLAVAAVNGKPRIAATEATWVLSGTTVNDYTTSVLLVRTGSSAWAAYPARFTGCRAG